MAYEPTKWASGDVITAEKLNHIETGIASVPKGDTGAAGPKGDKGDAGAAGAKGAAGLGIKSLAFTTTDGKVTAGTVTFSDDTTAPVTVTETPAR